MIIIWLEFLASDLINFNCIISRYILAQIYDDGFIFSIHKHSKAVLHRIFSVAEIGCLKKCNFCFIMKNNLHVHLQA